MLQSNAINKKMNIAPASPALVRQWVLKGRVSFRAAPVAPAQDITESGKIPIKEWVHAEMEKRGVKYTTVHMSVKRGKYPALKRWPAQGRSMFVLNPREASRSFAGTKER